VAITDLGGFLWCGSEVVCESINVVRPAFYYDKELLDGVENVLKAVNPVKFYAAEGVRLPEQCINLVYAVEPRVNLMDFED
jgi:hypothetical protein